ncbi:MAG: hypothetical protein M3Q81_01910 [bacterium]|nr:hypothetical protein [bacterium]
MSENKSVKSIKEYLLKKGLNLGVSETTMREVFEVLLEQYFNEKLEVDSLSTAASYILYNLSLHVGRKFEDARFQDLLEYTSELDYKLSKESGDKKEITRWLHLYHDAMVKQLPSTWHLGVLAKKIS